MIDNSFKNAWQCSSRKQPASTMWRQHIYQTQTNAIMLHYWQRSSIRIVLLASARNTCTVCFLIYAMLNANTMFFILYDVCPSVDKKLTTCRYLAFIVARAHWQLETLNWRSLKAITSKCCMDKWIMVLPPKKNDNCFTDIMTFP